MNRRIAARPTMYRGVQMRSRLEATVAEWFDAHRIRWTYEPLVYAGPSGQYLPDFELHDLHIANTGIRPFFAEIKPAVTGLDVPGVLGRMEVILDSHPTAVVAVLSPHDDTFHHFAYRERSPNGETITRIDGTFAACEHCGTVTMERLDDWLKTFEQEPPLGIEGPPWFCPARDCGRVGFLPINPWLSEQSYRYTDMHIRRDREPDGGW